MIRRQHLCDNNGNRHVSGVCLDLVWPPRCLGHCWSVLYCRSQSDWSCTFLPPGFPGAARADGRSYSEPPTGNKEKREYTKKNPSHFLQRRHGCIISPLQQDCCRLWSTGRPLPLCRQWSGIHPEKLFWWAEGRLDREEPGPLEAGPVLEGTTETTSADLKSFHRQGVKGGQKMYRIWFDCQWIWKVMWKCEDRSRIWGGKWSNQNRISIILYINIIIHHSIKLTFDSFLWSKMTVWGHNWATNTAVIRKKSSKKYLVSSWSCWNSGSYSVPHLLWRWQWPCHCSPASSRPSLSVWTRIGQPPDQSPWQLRCLRSRSSHQQDHWRKKTSAVTVSDFIFEK